MTVYSRDNFPELRSEPDWFRTWCIRLFFLILFGSLPVLVYFAPLAFYMDGTINGIEVTAISIIYYPILTWLIYRAVRYLERIKQNAVKHIRVNSEGVFYEELDGTVQSLLFKQLERSSNHIVYDVFLDSKLIHTGTATYRQSFLKVFLKCKEKPLRAFHPNVCYSYYAKNSRAMRSHFIQGITLFRPDLRIAPNVYSNYYIHPETFEFDRKVLWKTVVLVVIFFILLFIGIELYMKHRFGNSLIF